MFHLINTEPYSLHALLAEMSRPKPSNVIDLAAHRQRRSERSESATTKIQKKENRLRQSTL